MTTPPPDSRIAVAQNLTAIVELAGGLEEQAINDANDHLMPGGLAMVALGTVANLEAWTHKLDAAERRAIDCGTHLAVDDDDEWEPPLQMLLFWSERLRRAHGQEFEPTPHRPYPTLASEANIIRHHVDWLWDNEPHWDKFTTDMGAAVSSLENILKAGSRPDRIRVICDRCPSPKRLILVWARREHVADECTACGELYDPDVRDQCAKCGGLLAPAYNSDPADDRWKCPSCKQHYDADDVARAHAKQLRSEGAEKFVPLVDAIGTLRGLGRGERTIRRWLADGDVETQRLTPGRVEAWWPDLWRLHLSTPTKKRVG